MIGKYFTAEQREMLDECLETEKAIDPIVAEKLIDAGIYKFYAFDERINADCYILDHFDKCLGLPGWLHVYKEY